MDNAAILSFVEGVAGCRRRGEKREKREKRA
jgi:hypothetical protein